MHLFKNLCLWFSGCPRVSPPCVICPGCLCLPPTTSSSTSAPPTRQSSSSSEGQAHTGFHLLHRLESDQPYVLWKTPVTKHWKAQPTSFMSTSVFVIFNHRKLNFWLKRSSNNSVCVGFPQSYSQLKSEAESTELINQFIQMWVQWSSSSGFTCPHKSFANMNRCKICSSWAPHNTPRISMERQDFSRVCHRIWSPQTNINEAPMFSGQCPHYGGHKCLH